MQRHDPLGDGDGRVAPAGDAGELEMGPAHKLFFFSRSETIWGGTAEIQRNIVAEQVLGLPADVRADKGLPFNKIPTGRH
mgnify:CR=1 FL=1